MGEEMLSSHSNTQDAMDLAHLCNDASAIRLILTDIDGTILPYDRSVVSQECRDAFHAAYDAGIHIGPATGRGATRVPSVFEHDEKCYATMLAANGMQVILDGQFIYEAHIPHEALIHLASIIHELPDCGMICFDGPQALVVEGTIDNLAKSFRSYAATARLISEVPSFPVIKTNIFTPPIQEKTAEIVALLRREVPEIDYSLPMPGFVNTTPRGWNKAAAVDYLAQTLGIAPEQVVVFGDSGNDLEMLSHVPHSVAVAGATDEARAAARWHIGSCEDEAVPQAIKKLAQGLWPFTN